MRRCGHVSKIWTPNWDFDSEYAARWQMRSILTLCCPRSPQMRSSVRHRHGLGYTCGIDSDGSWIAMFPHWTRTGSGKTAPTNSRLLACSVARRRNTRSCTPCWCTMRTRSKNWGRPEKEKESEKAGRMIRSKWTPLQRDCATWSLCSRPCFRTPRGNPAQSTVTRTDPAQSRHNHVLTTRSNQIGKIMTPVWVAVGLRWIWWFLVCNLWLVSRLYLQPDMSACQSSCLSCPQFQKTDESFSHPVSILKLSPCHYRCSGWNIRTEYLERHELNSSDSTANICTQTFASGQKLVFAASGENAILHCKAVNLKLTRILKWLKIFFLTYHY